MAFDSLAQLRTYFLFADLTELQFSRLQAVTKKVQLSADQHLFQFNDPARYFYLLCTGQIQLYRLSAGGEEKVFEIIAPGQSFAEAVMFLNSHAYPVSAKAIDDAVLWQVEMNTFREILQQSGELCLRLLGHMSRRLHGAIQDIDELTLQNASMRVIQLLLKAMPADCDSGYTVELETPKQILASRLSVRPETFSRILQQLSRKGLIVVQGKTVLVPDAVKLQGALEIS